MVVPERSQQANEYVSALSSAFDHPQVAAHARLANCDVALSFQDTFSILERLLPQNILLAAANAASASRSGGKGAEASTAGAEKGSAGAESSGKGGSLEALRAKADAELWRLLNHAEKRGSTFDLRVELADWGVSWEPWRSKGVADRERRPADNHSRSTVRDFPTADSIDSLFRAQARWASLCRWAWRACTACRCPPPPGRVGLWR